MERPSGRQKGIESERQRERERMKESDGENDQSGTGMATEGKSERETG